MSTNVVKIKQCIYYMVYKNKAIALAISVLASYLYKFQYNRSLEKLSGCWHLFIYIYSGL